MLEIHLRFAVRLPSWMSEALPEKLMVVPLAKEEPFTGLLMATVGGSLGAALTVTVTKAVAVLPPESVTCAVIVWVPLLKVREKLPPVPIEPSMLEVQVTLAVRLPSCASAALPEKLMVVP